jgi:hypothetical protein
MMTDDELRRAADRALDRAIRRVMADDWRIHLSRRRHRLRDLMSGELEQLEQNLYANGEGIVTFQVDMLFDGYDRVPDLRVTAGRMTRAE